MYPRAAGDALEVNALVRGAVVDALARVDQHVQGEVFFFEKEF
jgi:hypothetical protein